MLTPVISNKKVKAENGRKAAKELILRRELTTVPAPDNGDAAENADVGGKKATSPITDAGENEFTVDELSRLDVLFDILSWLTHLFAGNYKAMNELGGTIGFGQLDIAKVDVVKSKLREQVDGLISKVESMIEQPKPIEATAVSDIENEIKALV
jgi:hypothetical protein